ncbi:MAG: S-methyl-5'-thioadenosine phosphorylase [bacterium]
MQQAKIGIIGGSGLYHIEGLTNVEEISLDTPFGKPSDVYIKGTLEDTDVAFLPRHGREHTILPSELNFRANIFGFKKLGVEHIISVSAVGSMRENLKPTDILIPNQFFDHTKGRNNTFFGNGLVAHISLADPTCPQLDNILYKAGQEIGCNINKGGTYICIEGPQFSTKAESNIYRKWGVDVIGMTNISEAKLAREAEICYSVLALVTDYDVWHETEENVTAEAIIKILNQNVDVAKQIIKKALPKITSERPCLCASALGTALLTPKDKIPAKVKEDLRPIIGKYV